MSNPAQEKAAAMFDGTRTSVAIGKAKNAIAIMILGVGGFGVWWYAGNVESSSAAYRLVNAWYADDDYRDLVPMIRNAMDDGVLRQTEWWEIAARQEEIEQTRQREELLKTVVQGLP